jgi:hypothetical protein
MTADEIWEECICDSLGDMNIFADVNDLGEFMEGILPDIKKAASQNKAPTQTRGSPEGKASRETDATLANETEVESGGQYGERESENSEPLEGEGISTAYRSENGFGEYSKNTRTLQSLLGISDSELRKGNFRAGQSEWVENYTGELGFVEPAEIQRLRRFLQSFRGKLSRTKLKNTDTVGRPCLYDGDY